MVNRFDDTFSDWSIIRLAPICPNFEETVHQHRYNTECYNMWAAVKDIETVIVSKQDVRITCGAQFYQSITHNLFIYKQSSTK